MNIELFSEVELTRDVAICAKDLKGLSPPHQHILHKLLKDLLHENASREYGFYLGITALKNIGPNNNNDQPDVLSFPVSFTCRTFLPEQGDVKMVLQNGVIISSGPLRVACLSSLKMPGYHYVPAESEDEKPYFQRYDLSKIVVGVVVRFKVVECREWTCLKSNAFWVLASVEGEKLGPISLTGSDDEPYM